MLGKALGYFKDKPEVLAVSAALAAVLERRERAQTEATDSPQAYSAPLLPPAYSAPLLPPAYPAAVLSGDMRLLLNFAVTVAAPVLGGIVLGGGSVYFCGIGDVHSSMHRCLP